MWREINDRMNVITNLLKSDRYVNRFLQALEGGAKRVYLHGLLPESTGHFLVFLAETIKRPVFLVSSSEKRAMELTEGLESISEGKAFYFPNEEINFFRADSVISSNRQRRMAVMERLVSGGPLIVTTTLQALSRPVSPPEVRLANRLSLELGREYPIEEVLEKLVTMGYERVMTVEHRGQFALRGGIIDIFPPSEKKAFRIEFFDVEVDSIRAFSVEDQRSTDSLDRIEVGPAEEVLLRPQDIREALKSLKKEADSLSKKKGDREGGHLEDVLNQLIEDYEEGGKMGSSDFLLPFLPPRALSSLAAYLPEEGMVVFEDLDRILEKEEDRIRMEAEDLVHQMDRGDILPSHMNFIKEKEEVLDDFRDRAQVNLSQILKQSPRFRADQLIQIRSMGVESFKNRWDDLVTTLRRRLGQGYRILFLAGSSAPGIADQFRESGLDNQLILLPESTGLNEKGELDPGRLYVVNRSYPQGFRYPDSKLAVLTMTELSGAKKRKKIRPKKKAGNFLNYQDLDVGDFVVHELYGVGQFKGTETMSIGGITKDFLKISYRASDILYVPTDEMGMVSKYISKESKAPKLNSLGTADWKKSKARVKKALDAIAEDLVALYAERAKVQGHAFGPDTPWQAKFEEDFPYEETPSQLRATAEIKEDMESIKPMDRLLCGDVGYGKTEVALRAAFKAIMDGKQVAFLCPTTILTQQHYQTIKDRFRNFPARVEFLSRFKTTSQQKEVVKQIEKGSVDIVVGTHRLLSKDIHFHDLGLLIVDEEQRFGVKDKEKIKKRWKNVDVLTLSATPIPRTLQLSLTGIRDMSLLEEPPEERYPTTSYVMEYDPGVVQDAIERELDRDGQVYIIHNRVYDINKIAGHIQSLVPQASLAVAHGQMTTNQLEGVMESFVSGQVDILLATAIVETGMDIPNVNTLVVLRADRMGLSQLYQLKGRIGRADRRSYAYFTYQRDKVLTEDSEKRLKAIRDFTEFGSGYKIAMRDLELRGAGNILGESQSGHIESIGYDLYVKMLEEAVSRVKGEEAEEKIREINVDIKASAYIPDSYIGQSTEKIMMYRQIASIGDEEDYSTIIEELIDRFGDPPKSVINLMDIVLIKRWASQVGFSQVKEIDDFVELRYDSFDLFSVEELKEIAETFQGPLSFDFQAQPKFKVKSSPHKIRELTNLVNFVRKLKAKTI